MKLILKVSAIVIALFLGAFALMHTSQARLAVGTEGERMQTNANPRTLYSKHCATCHGNDGRSKTFKGKFKHARDLADAEWQARVSDERIFNSINNGRGKMPSFEKKLSESQINALVGYVRQLKK
ncbi:MAG: cytochrome c [Pyrinomonadaceae bacterium]